MSLRTALVNGNGHGHDVPEPGAISVQRLAIHLGVSDDTILDEIAAGELKAFKVRTAWRIDRLEAEAYLARVGGAPLR